MIFYGNDLDRQLSDLRAGILDVALFDSGRLASRGPDAAQGLWLLRANADTGPLLENPYPFPTSTPLAPGPGLAAGPNVPGRLRSKVCGSSIFLQWEEGPVCNHGLVAVIDTPAYDGLHIKISVNRKIYQNSPNASHFFHPPLSVPLPPPPPSPSTLS